MVLNCGDGWRDGHGGQTTTTFESRIGNVGDGWRNGHSGQGTAVSENVATDVCDRWRDGHRGQPRATRESKLPDSGDRRRYGYGGQARAVIKSTFPNGSNTVFYILHDDAGRNDNITRVFLRFFDDFRVFGAGHHIIPNFINFHFNSSRSTYNHEDDQNR